MFSRQYLEQLPGSEKAAYFLERKVHGFIKTRGGQFLRDEAGNLHVVIDGKRALIDYNRSNRGMADLMVSACGVTTLGAAAQATIQRLQVVAAKNTSALRLRRFSAISDDRQRLYVPSAGGGLIRVTADGIASVPNGNNDDSFWVEHPYASPLTYTAGDTAGRLASFERLIVETQACVVPEMKWFVAMAEGLFPFIRELCPARLLTVHLGASQSGKTTGAKRFTLLHGLGDVKGDYSVAALGNMPDIGLLVLDNKEQANFGQQLIDYCLFLATGAERGRSTSEGELRTSGSRPVGVITSIEGVHKAELQKRCVNIEYAARAPMLRRGPIEKEIADLRNELGSGLVQVFPRYLEISSAPNNLPNPIPEFEEHFMELCFLLQAFGHMAGKSAEWAEDVIDVWDEALGTREEESELEQPIQRVLKERAQGFRREMVQHGGRAGTLHVTEVGDLLTELQHLDLRELILPRNAQGLGRRLRSTNFRTLTFLDAENAPELDCLRRTAHARPIGLFTPQEEEVNPLAA